MYFPYLLYIVVLYAECTGVLVDLSEDAFAAMILFSPNAVDGVPTMSQELISF